MSALNDFFRAEQLQIEAALHRHLPISDKRGTARFNAALNYSVFPGGKRLRPMITVLAGRLVGADERVILPNACAIEFLHTSSLILDDLPGMDDAALRRNQTATHLVFGEGLAVLAAVALLNQAYALFLESARSSANQPAFDELLSEAVACIGGNGMIGGQVVDLETSAGLTDAEILAQRDTKTIALMRLMMTASALASGAGRDTCAALREFGTLWGEAYQICDDLIDEVADSSLTGKPSGQDSRHLRPTAVAGMGQRDSYRRAVLLFARCEALLRNRFGNRPEVELLADISNSVLRPVNAVGESSTVSADGLVVTHS